MRAGLLFLIGAMGLAAPVESSHAQIFVAQNSPGRVGKYNASTGAPIVAGFISGVINPKELLLSGNTLYVSDSSTGLVGTYNATTGGAINASFINGLIAPGEMALAGTTLFVTNNGNVGAYN